MTAPDDAAIPVHPVQNNPYARPRGRSAVAPQVVTMRAYEVYKHVYGEQVALVTGGCRGGFGVGELVALLYAYGFPKSEWSARCREAFTGMDL